MCNFFPIYSYNDALELVASGKVNVKPLITHNYKIEDTKQAFETSRTGAGGAIKVMIHCKQMNRSMILKIFNVIIVSCKKNDKEQLHKDNYTKKF